MAVRLRVSVVAGKLRAPGELSTVAADVMRSFFISALSLCIVACSPPLGGATDGGASGADSGQTEALTGTGCAQDPDTGVTLCAQVSACPSLVFDRERYPRCGFRIRAGAFDLACTCSGYVCPMGTPSSCAEAARLLGPSTELDGCDQVSTGRCTGPAQPAPQPTSQPCDRQCLSECGGGAGCARVCNCS